MKSLTQYILEAQSKPTLEWMKEYYDKFNKELFDNQLPSNIRLGLISNTKEKALGWQAFNHAYNYSKDYMRGDMYIMLYFDKTISYTFNGHRQTVDVSKAKHATSAEELSPFIELNPRYQFSDFQKEDTLIHEMIHLWVHRNGLGPKRAHGKEFKAKCDEALHEVIPQGDVVFADMALNVVPGEQNRLHVSICTKPEIDVSDKETDGISTVRFDRKPEEICRVVKELMASLRNSTLEHSGIRIYEPVEKDMSCKIDNGCVSCTVVFEIDYPDYVNHTIHGDIEK